MTPNADQELKQAQAMSENVQPEELTPKQHSAIRALLSARTLGDAAREAQVTHRQLSRWLELPEFKAALSAAQQECLDIAIRRLSELSGVALDTLKSVMVSKRTSSPARVRAALGVLDYLLKYKELDEFEERLKALEARLLKGGDE